MSNVAMHRPRGQSLILCALRYFECPASQRHPVLTETGVTVGTGSLLTKA